MTFTLYRNEKRSVAKCVSDRAPVHTRNANFGTIFAPEQDCSAPLLKVKRSVQDKLLKQSGPSLNTFIGAEIATDPLIRKFDAATTGPDVIRIEPAWCRRF